MLLVRWNLLLIAYYVWFTQKKYYWERIGKIHSEYYISRIIKSQDELLDDIIQGNLGDCYFLSALNALAENPKRILELLPSANNTNDNSKKEGALQVNCYINGEKKSIILDDYFPVEIDENNQLTFKEENEDEK